ncbi:MAG: hypothetical protein M3P18_10035 [Actinomycetota bacterium]|nr:hypothetical protein [Actinomycetota bacterium]
MRTRRLDEPPGGSAWFTSSADNEIDVAAVAELWRRGSVVASWLPGWDS